ANAQTQRAIASLFPAGFVRRGLDNRFPFVRSKACMNSPLAQPNGHCPDALRPYRSESKVWTRTGLERLHHETPATETLAMPPVHSLTLKLSSNRAATANASRSQDRFSLSTIALIRLQQHTRHVHASGTFIAYQPRFPQSWLDARLRIAGMTCCAR